MPSTAKVSADVPGPRRISRWWVGCLVVYLVLLTFALLPPDPFVWFRTPSSAPPQPLPFYLAWLSNDKVHHFTAYGILTGLLLAATSWSPTTIFIAAAVHGGSMEILQQ